ncbi:MAG: FAD synthase [Candidatus Taylorbacteria bacterium CG11_big_fil_rev_8_21_14_0_20_46_11]|uniref:FAD synthase n=1 Tax=Candidatus Taylorbacteria bacterium CG11_big_fil_rev_8_21_14_0_20_46_11 TaxID=1975025 RepID=A0A2H0KDG8_9BACT|nr:MAG: FAD synthase [Candidatus Taylorbacteria bacterium CG11_big_fil_rev_8_21_14_0_20_46_11]
MDTPKTVLVFGTFDGLHDGHRFFLRESRKLGERLVAIVAQDTIVEQIKGYLPVFPLQERIQLLLDHAVVDDVLEGDTKLGTWSTVTKVKPDVIAVGYDQKHLEEKLREHIQSNSLSFEVVQIAPHDPDRLHSSILRSLNEKE